MKKSVWVLAAMLTMPAVALLGQQNGTANSDGSNNAAQSTHEGNHAMQTGSPNDTGGGLNNDYGNRHSGKKHKRHHRRHRTKKYSNETGPTQSRTRSTDQVNPH